MKRLPRLQPERPSLRPTPGEGFRILSSTSKWESSRTSAPPLRGAELSPASEGAELRRLSPASTGVGTARAWVLRF